MAFRAGGWTLGWRAKREVLPGGPKGVLREVALSKQQVVLAKVPRLATDIAVAAATPEQRFLRATDPFNDPGERLAAPRPEQLSGLKVKAGRERLQQILDAAIINTAERKRVEHDELGCKSVHNGPPDLHPAELGTADMRMETAACLLDQRVI